MTLKVLTIDDDPALTELLTLLLRSRGHDAHMANSGQEGVRLSATFTRTWSFWT